MESIRYISFGFASAISPGILLILVTLAALIPVQRYVQRKESWETTTSVVFSVGLALPLFNIEFYSSFIESASLVVLFLLSATCSLLLLSKNDLRVEVLKSHKDTSELVLNFSGWLIVCLIGTAASVKGYSFLRFVVEGRQFNGFQSDLLTIVSFVIFSAAGFFLLILPIVFVLKYLTLKLLSSRRVIKSTYAYIMLFVAFMYLSKAVPAKVAMLLWAAFWIVSSVFLGVFEKGRTNKKIVRMTLGLMMLIHGILILVYSALGRVEPFEPIRNFIKTVLQFH